MNNFEFYLEKAIQEREVVNEDSYALQSNFFGTLAHFQELVKELQSKHSANNDTFSIFKKFIFGEMTAIDFQSFLKSQGIGEDLYKNNKVEAGEQRVHDASQIKTFWTFLKNKIKDARDWLGYNTKIKEIKKEIESTEK